MGELCCWCDCLGGFRVDGEEGSCGLGQFDVIAGVADFDAAAPACGGYGMAVAQAQHAVKDMTRLLENKGVEVKYAIHPVAGRMPGHMNVLLAEADVPYEQLKEMDDINDEFSRTDVSLVIGANDVTNPAARSDPNSPIHGMPILNVDESKSVTVLKRSMNPGFAGIQNELYYADQTSMLFGDAKSSVEPVIEELKAL